MTTWLEGFETARPDDVLALRPAAAHRMRELESALWEDDRLDHSLVELVRSRVGRLLGLPDVAVATGDRSSREQAAIDFAEQYVLDPSGVTDTQTAELNRLFSEPELTALTFCIAVFDAIGRVHLVLDIADRAVFR
jgi:alkylhydroperoxidase family enzyme